jgi:hypothetical protein
MAIFWKAGEDWVLQGFGGTGTQPPLVETHGTTTLENNWHSVKS